MPRILVLIISVFFFACEKEKASEINTGLEVWVYSNHKFPVMLVFTVDSIGNFTDLIYQNKDSLNYTVPGTGYLHVPIPSEDIYVYYARIRREPQFISGTDSPYVRIKIVYNNETLEDVKKVMDSTSTYVDLLIQRSMPFN